MKTKIDNKSFKKKLFNKKLSSQGGMLSKFYCRKTRAIDTEITYIQSGTKKKRNFFKVDFLIFIFIKIHHIIYQIKHNWMNFMMVKNCIKKYFTINI